MRCYLNFFFPIFQVYWYGIDGLGGPMMSGTNFYIKREALYDRRNIHNGI